MKRLDALGVAITGKGPAAASWRGPARMAAACFAAMLLLALAAAWAGLAAGCSEKREPAAAEAEAPGGPRVEREGTGEGGLGDRLAVLSPAIARIVRDLGHADLMVARHGFDAWSDQSLPVAGDQAGIDYEALIGVRPTAVYVQWGKRELPAPMVKLAEERGWAVRNYELLTLEQVREGTAEMARELGGGEELLKRMDEAWSAREGVDAEKVGKVLLVANAAPVGALGPGSAHAELLERLGGRSVLTEGGPYQVLDAEDVLRLAPGAIVVFAPRGPGEESQSGVAPREEYERLLGVVGKLGVPAVERGRVAVIDDPMGLTPSTALVGVAEELGDLLEAWSQ